MPLGSVHGMNSSIGFRNKGSKMSKNSSTRNNDDSVSKECTQACFPLCNLLYDFEGLVNTAAESPQSSNKPNATWICRMLSVMNAICTKGQSSPVQFTD